MKFNYPPGATPLDLDEIMGLLPFHITAQGQLNEWEAANILKAENWIHSSNHENVLTIKFIRLVHQKMFDDTWRWAGRFRNTNKNIGVDYPMITTELKKLLDDVHYQFTNRTYAIDEIAYRFHHRLVSIHPFPNGNGRHARMLTDILLIKHNKSRFTWGTNNIESEKEIRKQYITALREADKHHYALLKTFVRT